MRYSTVAIHVILLYKLHFYRSVYKMVFDTKDYVVRVGAMGLLVLHLIVALFIATISMSQ